MNDSDITVKALMESHGPSMNIGQFAELLGVTVRTAKERLKIDDIQHIVVGRSYVIPTITVAKYIHRPATVKPSKQKAINYADYAG